jgi:hypothetical protein
MPTTKLLVIVIAIAMALAGATAFGVSAIDHSVSQSSKRFTPGPR